jgi:hypothetical protein
MLWSLTHTSYAKFAKLWLFTCAFLLRLPSEALPAFAGRGDHQSSVFMEGDTIVLVLKRRKNKPGGSRLVRTCWCSESKATCPVHRFGGMLRECAGQRLFEGITSASALAALREMLEGISVPNAASYRTHDFGRGHALDLQLSGARLRCAESSECTLCLVLQVRLYCKF